VEPAASIDLGIEGHDDLSSLTVDDVEIATFSDARELFVSTSVEIDRAAVAHSSDAYVIVHGACIARGDRAALIVGPSGAGKTTLAAALTLAGLQYVADEVVGIPVDATTVAAYPKPFKLDGRSRCLLTKLSARHPVALDDADHEILVEPETFGCVTRTGHLVTVALVVMPTIAEGASASIEPLSRADVAELLADQCFNFSSWGARGLSTVATVARAASGVRVRFGDVGAAATAIEGLLR
jgi:hypothetical protein